MPVQVNSELLAMTYGAIVTQLIKDYKVSTRRRNTQEAPSAAAHALSRSRALRLPALCGCARAGRGRRQRGVGEDVGAALHTALLLRIAHRRSATDSGSRASVCVCDRGYNIGIRLIDEFLSRASGVSCSNFRESCSVLAKVAFKMFLGITAEVGRWRADGRQCVLSFKGNPLLDFVELPQHLARLDYSNLIAGVIRGACCMIQMTVSVEWVKDELKGTAKQRRAKHSAAHCSNSSTPLIRLRCPSLLCRSGRERDPPHAQGDPAGGVRGRRGEMRWDETTQQTAAHAAFGRCRYTL